LEPLLTEFLLPMIADSPAIIGSVFAACSGLDFTDSTISGWNPLVGSQNYPVHVKVPNPNPKKGGKLQGPQNVRLELMDRVEKCEVVDLAPEWAMRNFRGIVEEFHVEFRENCMHF
jgi:hypothetical protein